MLVLGRRSAAERASREISTLLSAMKDGDKLFQFTKICNAPKLTVIFAAIKIDVSFSMPMPQYPQLLLIRSNTHLLSVSSLYS
jgi:hypothetical protein